VDVGHLDAFVKEYSQVPEEKRAEFLANKRLQVRATAEVRSL
jgi:hypothetical protein